MATFSEYIDVISTASSEIYPNNDNASFTNELPYTMEFPPGTMVALTECSYNNAFYNIQAEHTKISVWDPYKKLEPHTTENPTDYVYWGGYYLVELMTGYYKSIEDICLMLNKVLKATDVKQLQNNRVFTFDRKMMKVRCTLANEFVALFIQGPLLNLLGVEMKQANSREYTIIGCEKTGRYYEIDDPNDPGDPNNPDKPKKKLKRYYIAPELTWPARIPNSGFFNHPAQLTTFKSLIIYSDLIQDQVIGSDYAQALRFVPIKGTSNDKQVGQLVVWEPTIPHYLRVKQRNIKSISIRILDHQGNKIKFLMGVVRLKLHFKVPQEEKQV